MSVEDILIRNGVMKSNEHIASGIVGNHAVILDGNGNATYNIERSVLGDNILVVNRATGQIEHKIPLTA